MQICTTIAEIRAQLEQFPKSVKRFSDKNCGENKQLEQISDSIESHSALLPVREANQTIGLVPTMGALHHGHMKLVEQARHRCDCVVASIFVNPKQFDEPQDFDAYPRHPEADFALLQQAGVRACFAPTIEEMWPSGHETIVETVHLANILMGALRPGHFRGVATVVAKLFNIIQPTHAFFGEKDFQQLAIIRRMVKDLNFPIEIVGVPIARDGDGVAQSSRNALLGQDERRGAAIIPQALDVAAKLYAAGERQTQALVTAVLTVLAHEKLATVEAVDMRDCETLDAVGEKLDRPAVLLLTVRFGAVRLIDQHVFN